MPALTAASLLSIFKEGSTLLKRVDFSRLVSIIKIMKIKKILNPILTNALPLKTVRHS
jgi:hypothetical protein